MGKKKLTLWINLYRDYFDPQKFWPTVCIYPDKVTAVLAAKQTPEYLGTFPFPVEVDL